MIHRWRGNHSHSLLHTECSGSSQNGLSNETIIKRVVNYLCVFKGPLYLSFPMVMSWEQSSCLHS